MAVWQRWGLVGVFGVLLAGVLLWAVAQPGRQARFDARLAAARLAFTAAYGSRTVTPGAAKYQGRAALLAAPDRVAGRAQAELDGLVGGDLWSPGAEAQPALRFWLDLLAGADLQGAREWAVRTVRAGNLNRFLTHREALPVLFTRPERERMAEEATGYTAALLLWTAEPDQAMLERFFLAHAGEPVQYEALQLPGAREAALAVYPRLGRAARLSLVRMGDLVGMTDLQAWHAREDDPAVRQELLVRLRDEAGLLASWERDGFFPGVSFHWELQRRLAAQNPDSFLARGIRAYEAVRGRPYFEWDRREMPPEFGDRHYDPDREIPGWERFLAEFSRHEAADDAAYRLGRAYEIQGRYAEALAMLHRAQGLGDGEMAYDARARIIWILDAHLTDEQVSALAETGLGSPELASAAAYSAALRTLRAGRYAEAAAALERLMAGREGGAVLTVHREYPFWYLVRRQLEAVQELARLAERQDPEGRYAVAAYMYHREYLFYSHLWAGGRQGYLRTALRALQGDMAEPYRRWAAGTNHLIQAAEAFRSLAGTPDGGWPGRVWSGRRASVRDRAEYSRAIALLRLVSYGPDVALWRPLPEVEAEGKSVLSRLAAERPKSPLAPDALLTLAFLSGDQARFDALAREYPRSGAAETARGLVAAHLPRQPDWNRLKPFRYLADATLPPAVATALAESRGRESTRVITVDGVRYLVGTVADPGHRVVLTLTEDRLGSVRASARSYPAPGGTGYAVAQIWD